MKTGISIIVFNDGGIRLKRDASREEHDAAIQPRLDDLFTNLFSPAEDPPLVILELATEPL